MDIRVTVGGVEAVVTVQDATEAATLLATLANMKSGNGHVPAPPVLSGSSLIRQRATEAMQSAGDESTETPSTYNDSDVRAALLGMKGKPVAKFLAALLDYPSG